MSSLFATRVIRNTGTFVDWEFQPRLHPCICKEIGQQQWRTDKVYLCCHWTIYLIISVRVALCDSVLNFVLLIVLGVYTREAMENYKSLDAHIFFRSGWVQTVYHCKTEKGNFVFRADGRPSFRVSEEPHHPWVATTDSGRVIAAHCDCMAGLGETCSHVGALLYKLEAAMRLCISYWSTRQ